MAQSIRKPVAIVCTSGTAAYNLAPAVAEAWFSKTPLIVFTADRPAEWIGQHDGQTIYQGEIFGRHVKQSFQLPQDYDHNDSVWAINRMVNEAINTSIQAPSGPVHINAPFREPLYPPAGENTITYGNVRTIEEYPSVSSLSDNEIATLRNAWTNYHNILVVAGQGLPDAAMR
jgi:2-succinyl-5-enolpyruvyl-6-hydroxy-3-cyclohexene-1-carboxylate synthase